MIIRQTTLDDLDTCGVIYQSAREYMKSHDNPNQWEDNRPSVDAIIADIQNGDSYVLEEKGEIVGVFSFVIGDDPTYKVIENGHWSYDKPYGTIHKVASSGKARGIAKACFDYCSSQIDYLRIDTHKDNVAMQRAIKDYGFKECGIIYVSNGARIAFDRG